MKKDFVTVETAAHRLGVPRSTLYYHVKRSTSSQLPRYKRVTARGVWFHYSEIQHWWEKINKLAVVE